MQKSPQNSFYNRLLVEILFIFILNQMGMLLLAYLPALLFLFRTKKRNFEKRLKVEELLRIGLIERLKNVPEFCQSTLINNVLFISRKDLLLSVHQKELHVKRSFNSQINYFKNLLLIICLSLFFYAPLLT
ncbi:hypothetical protein ACKWTF_002653 [Chironomus riparius]